MAMTRAISQGHDLVDKKMSVLRPAPDNTANWPAGSVFSNVADLARLTTALMDGGKIEGKQALASDAVAAMTSPHADIPGSKTKYGYGLDVEGSGDGRLWQHSGSRAGYGSYISMIPANRVAMIVLCNKTGENLPKLRSAVMAMLGRPEPGMGEVNPTTLPTSEFSQFVGTYRNGETKREIVERDGKLFQGIAEITKRDGNWLLLKAAGEGAPARIFVVRGPNGTAEYLFQGGRASARLR
jgi:CubicO group peptidase (beta-lactamase class C family)